MMLVSNRYRIDYSAGFRFAALALDSLRIASKSGHVSSVFDAVVFRGDFLTGLDIHSIISSGHVCAVRAAMYSLTASRTMLLRLFALAAAK
jgi:hypothetical protein